MRVCGWFESAYLAMSLSHNKYARGRANSGQRTTESCEGQGSSFRCGIAASQFRHFKHDPRRPLLATACRAHATCSPPRSPRWGRSQSARALSPGWVLVAGTRHDISPPSGARNIDTLHDSTGRHIAHAPCAARPLAARHAGRGRVKKLFCLGVINSTSRRQ